MLRSVLSSSRPLARRTINTGRAYSTANPAKDELPPLPILQKPLGVKERPTALAKTWEERKADLLNQEKRLEQRRHL
jgi:ATPase complex subunit ATP10